MTGQTKRILDVFPLLSPSLSVTEARLRLREAAKQQGLNVGYGVVVDATGFPLTCLNTTMVADWPEQQTLDSLHALWPALYTLPRVHVSNSDAGMYLVARFFQEEIGGEDFVAIVLLDEAGKPGGILRKRVLTDIFAGRHTRSTEGEHPPRAIADSSSERELQVKRYTHLHFPAQVQLYQRCQLAITIRRNPPEDGTQSWELGLRRKDWPLKVVATLLSGQDQKDFRVEGPQSGTIEIPQNDDSRTLTFTLIPQSLGNKKISLLFEQNGTYLCMPEVYTEVVQAKPTTTMAAQVCNAPTIAEMNSKINVTIYIEKVQELIYNVRVRTLSDPMDSKPRLIDQIELSCRPDTYLETIFQDLNEKTGLTPDDYDREVKIIGENLFEKLFNDDPKDPTRSFKRFYWQEMHPLPEGSYVQIVSDEPYIPWEILRPSRKNDDGYWDTGEDFLAPFLCQRFALTRWLSGPPCSGSLQLQNITLVAPSSKLEWVESEVDAISRIGKVTKIGDLSQLLEFLQHGEANILHFACHGKFQSIDPGRSVVILGNRTFRPQDIAPGYRYFANTRPLVFMNSCDSGREGIGLTGLDGWATTFVKDAGIGFFIGSVWKTTDELAYMFAKVFYNSLQNGYSIGEATRLARKAIEKSGDATYLSYTVYANPCIGL